MQKGREAAGEVLCEMLLGKCYPSGHLQDIFAYRIEDYPSTATFAKSLDHVDYEEDIFVGYRYFETFAPEEVVYPFGFGLALSANAAAMNRYAQLSESEKQTILNKAHSVHSEKEMYALVASLANGTE